MDGLAQPGSLMESSLGTSRLGADNGKLEAGYGFANRERQIPFTSRTLTNVGSLSKQLPQWESWDLVLDGRIDLDAAIGVYLPDATRPANAATIQRLDLAKNVFQVHGVAADGGVVVRRQLRRGQVLDFFAAQSPCLVGCDRADAGDAGEAPAGLVLTLARKKPKVAAVALANKTARIAWVLMARKQSYVPATAQMRNF